MLKVHTIINQGRLIGTIKLPEEIFNSLRPHEALLLIKQQNVGDTTIMTFELLIETVRIEGANE